MRRLWPVVSLLTIAVCAAPVWGVGPDGQEDICSTPAVFFCENFEDRGLGAGDLTRAKYKNPGWQLSEFSSMTVVNTQSFDGSKALQFAYPAGTDGIGFMGTAVPTLRTIYFRWYQKWSSSFTFSGIATKGASLETNGSGQSLYIWWNNWGDGGISHWANPIAVEFEANVGGTFVPVRDRWYCLEIRATMNTGSNADGRLQGWVDGVQRWDYANVLLDPVQPNEITFWILSGYWNFTATGHPQMFRWHDNFVASTARIGCLGAPPPLTPPTAPTSLQVQ